MSSEQGRVPATQSKRQSRSALKWVPVIVAVLALGTCRSLHRAYKIPSGAMQPSLNVGDHIFASVLAGNPPVRGEVIVFRFPENQDQHFVKRAIALPGDVLTVLDGRPILNGWMTPRCYVGQLKRKQGSFELYIEHYGAQSYGTLFEEKLDERACRSNADCSPGICAGGTCGRELQGPYKVAGNEVWVMGDNRNNTHDSRAWRGGLGAGVPFDLIIGSARSIWMSFAPGGGIFADRIGVSPQEPPRLLHGEGLEGEIERCVKARPAVTEPPR